jgi:hypothetical protein
MSFAPDSVNYAPYGDGTILGRFNLKENNYLFEFSTATEQVFGPNFFPHKIWVSHGSVGTEQNFRYGEVKKTVVYIVVDEDEMGNPVVQKWNIKNHTLFSAE